MKFYSFSLGEDDFLQFQLFTASRSKRIRNKRLRSWIITTGSFLLLGIILADPYNNFLFYYFMIASGLSAVFYPFYNRWRYKRHYRKFISENYVNKIGIKSEIGLGEEEIISKDKSGEAKLKMSEITSIQDLKEHLFIQLRPGESIIIPKKMDDFELFKNELKLITEKRAIPWNDQGTWKWR